MHVGDWIALDHLERMVQQRLNRRTQRGRSLGRDSWPPAALSAPSASDCPPSVHFIAREVSCAEEPDARKSTSLIESERIWPSTPSAA